MFFLKFFDHKIEIDDWDNSYYVYILPSEKKSGEKFLEKVYENIFVELTEKIINLGPNEKYAKLKEVYFKAANTSYKQVFYMIELFLSSLEEKEKNSFRNKFNQVFEDEYVAYRIIGDYVTDIDNKEEAEVIDSVTRIKNVGEYVQKALSDLYSRENKNYENAIRESRLALENFLQQVCEKRETLVELIKKPVSPLDKLNLHPAFIQALTNLYGFISDTASHPPKEGVKIDFETAKFILITIASTIIFLQLKLQKNSLLPAGMEVFIASGAEHTKKR